MMENFKNEIMEMLKEAATTRKPFMIFYFINKSMKIDIEEINLKYSDSTFKITMEQIVYNIFNELFEAIASKVFFNKIFKNEWDAEKYLMSHEEEIIDKEIENFFNI